jgi:hypothetical protein
MKNPKLMNPWPIIRWAVVTLLFAGTALIAMDQIKTRDAALCVANTKNDFLKNELLKASQRAAEIAKGAAKTEEKIRKALADYEVQMQAVEAKQRQQEARQTMMAAQVEIPQPAPSFSRLQQVAAPPQVLAASAHQAVGGDVSIPVWLPGAPSVINKGIKDRANNRWQTDYSMVNYQIDQDTQNYEKVVRYYKTSIPVVKQILNKAAQRWGTDYGMIIYELENQIEAKQKLDRR